MTSQNGTRRQHLKEVKALNRAIGLARIGLFLASFLKDYYGDSLIARQNLRDYDKVIECLTKYMWAASDEDFDILKKNYDKLIVAREKLRRG